MSTLTKKSVNGVDVEGLFKSIDAIKAMPNLGIFRFTLNNQWIDAGLNRSSIQNFYGTGQEHTSRKQPFILDSDEPAVLLGKDKGPSPVEYLLHAVAACVTSSIVYHAAARGIELKSIESRLDGEIDVRGFLGLDDNVPRGYKKITMKFKIEADIPTAQLEEIVNIGKTHSPVYNTLTRGVQVDVQLDK